MKKILTILITILLPICVFAQAPEEMSYQAVIRDASNKLVSSQKVGMQISILQGSSSGTAVYVETQTPTTNANGLVCIEIGGGTPVTGTFAAINWSVGPYFIKTETATIAPLTTYTIEGTSQLLSVPYAFYAKSSGGHYIGELFGGGIVVAIWKIAGIEKGLIASLIDVSEGSVWSNVSSEIGPTAQSTIDGQANTNAIIAQSGHTSSAAKICDDYINAETGTGVYSDWYLPAIWELNQCFNSALVVNTILGITNGFKLDDYYSSTERVESLSGGVFHQNFYFGNVGISDMSFNYIHRIRAVRRF